MYQVIERISTSYASTDRCFARCKTLLRAIRAAARRAPLNDRNSYHVIGPDGKRYNLDCGIYFTNRSGKRFMVSGSGHPAYCVAPSGYAPSLV